MGLRVQDTCCLLLRCCWLLSLFGFTILLHFYHVIEFCPVDTYMCASLSFLCCANISTRSACARACVHARIACAQQTRDYFGRLPVDENLMQERPSEKQYVEKTPHIPLRPLIHWPQQSFCSSDQRPFLVSTQIRFGCPDGSRHCTATPRDNSLSLPLTVTACLISVSVPTILPNGAPLLEAIAASGRNIFDNTVCLPDVHTHTCIDA